MNILEKLKQVDLYTETEQQVIDFINQNIDKISSMTIGELAKQSFSSNATIIRICHKLHCSGYKDFKYQLVKELETHKYLHQSIDFTTPFHTSQSTFDIINNLSSLYKESIDIIHSSLHVSQLEIISKILFQSQRIFIYSYGDTSLTVKNFMNKLMKINIYPILATENHEEIATSMNITQNDCVLFVSYRAQSSSLIQCINMIKETKCPTIIITANADSILTQLCHYSIIIPNKEKDDKIATFYSQLAFHYILTIIYALLHRRKDDAEL